MVLLLEMIIPLNVIFVIKDTLYINYIYYLTRQKQIYLYTQNFSIPIKWYWRKRVIQNNLFFSYNKYY